MRIAAACVVGIVGASTASAETPTSTSEFERGRTLQKDGKTAEACAAFAESLRLEFAYGTLFNVANCAEVSGKLGTAWKGYHRLALEDTTSGRAVKAQAKADELWARVPKLVLTVAHAPPNASFFVDGEAAPDSKPLPVDPGEHEVAAHAPGFRNWHRTVIAGGEGTSTEVVIALEPVGTVAPVPEPHGEPRVERRETGHRTLAIATLASGAGLILASGGLALYEKHVYDDAKSRLSSDPNAADEANSAVSVNRYVATSLFLAGAIAIPIGLVLWKQSDTVIVTPIATPDGAAVSFAGRF